MYSNTSNLPLSITKRQPCPISASYSSTSSPLSAAFNAKSKNRIVMPISTFIQIPTEIILLPQKNTNTNTGLPAHLLYMLLFSCPQF